jgi:hypothetical protein
MTPNYDDSVLKVCTGPEMRERVRVVAKRYSLSMSSWARMVIKDALERYEKYGNG